MKCGQVLYKAIIGVFVEIMDITKYSIDCEGAGNEVHVPRNEDKAE